MKTSLAISPVDVFSDLLFRYYRTGCIMNPTTSVFLPDIIQDSLKTETDLSVDAINATKVPQESVSEITQIKQLSIPVATYASMQVTDNMLHIAEESGGNIITHTKVLQSQDAAHETI